MDSQELLDFLAVPNLANHLQKVEAAMASSASSVVFKRPVDDLIARPGKRLRPMLLIASAKLCGRRIDSKVISAAAAVELIHLASLVHDDVIDDDSQLKPSEALLIGDFLIAAGLNRAATVNNEAVKTLSLTIATMAEGQARQLHSRDVADASNNFYLETIGFKTASLFAAAGRLGSLGSPYNQALSSYGQAFGTAFQIIDDIVDSEFAYKELERAKVMAQKYNQQAARNLRPVPISPLQKKLAALPKFYLDASLRDRL